MVTGVSRVLLTCEPLDALLQPLPRGGVAGADVPGFVQQSLQPFNFVSYIK